SAGRSAAGPTITRGFPISVFETDTRLSPTFHRRWERIMNSMSGQFDLPAADRAFSTPAKRGHTAIWSMPEPEYPQRSSDFAAILLATAVHDLRQPLQVMQYAHDSLGRGIRTETELKLLELGQTAIDRINQQLRDLLGALLLHDRAGKIELGPVRVAPLLRHASRGSLEAASRKNIGVRVVGTRAPVLSDPLLLGIILRNLVSNAVK